MPDSLAAVASLLLAGTFVAVAAAPKPAPKAGAKSPATASAPARPASGATPAVEVPTVFGFKAPISEGNRTVALVSGKEARPSLLAGQVQVTEFRLETYRYAPDRETELIVESPLGTFGGNGADSDRTISLRSADGRFGITGEGWNWNRNSGLLVISNRIETTVRRPGVAPNRPPIEVRSRRFEYNLRTGDARFRDDCEAHEPGQARIRAGELASRLTARAERPESIVATNGVTLELLRTGRTGRATGQSAVYSQNEEGERIELEGATTWAFGGGEGSADRLELRPAKDTYAARGHARLRLTTTSTNAGPATSSMDVACEAIEGGPREIVFTGPVTATRGSRLEVHAGRVVATLEPGAATSAGGAAANPGVPARPTRIEATERVQARIVAGSGPVDLQGGRMLYTLGEHDVIEVLEEPSWASPVHQGKAKRFVIHPQVPSFQAVDDVRMTWRSTTGTASTNAAPIEVTAGRMVVEPAEARFSGGVLARRQTWRLECADLDLALRTNSLPGGFAARGGAVFEYEMPAPVGGRAAATNASIRRPLGDFSGSGDPANRRWRVRAAEVRGALDPGTTNATPASLDATGDVRIENAALKAAGGRLVYRAGDGLMRLTENAWLTTESGLRIVGEPGTELLLDPKAGRFGVDRRWTRMTLPAGAFGGGISTNRLLKR